MLNELLIIIIIQSVANLIVSDKPLSVLFRRFISGLTEVLPKKGILPVYENIITEEDGVLVSEEKRTYMNISDIILFIFNCGYCLTFWITFNALILMNFTFLGAFSLAIANAYCYHILNYNK